MVPHHRAGNQNADIQRWPLRWDDRRRMYGRRVIQIARLMAAGEGEQAGICHVDMTGNEAEEEGMVCGGEVDVFLEIV